MITTNIRRSIKRSSAFENFFAPTQSTKRIIICERAFSEGNGCCHKIVMVVVMVGFWPVFFQNCSCGVENWDKIGFL